MTDRVAMSTKRSLIGLSVALLICLGAGGLGGLFTSQSVRAWYPLIQKPSWTPPSWLFGPVWTTLYVLMGVAAWLVWRRDPERPARGALLLFLGQLVLNVLWSALFFGLRAPGLAFAEIVVLELAVLGTLVAFWRHSRVAGMLLIPYLLWVGFASALNLAIWRLNA